MACESPVRQPLCAKVDGLGLYAAARVKSTDRDRPRHIYGCSTRPAPSDDRIQLNAAGELKLKSYWRDGATYLS